MKNLLLLVLALFFITQNNCSAQVNVVVELPEAYELSNVILALTNYGRSDKWEVQKNTKYYSDVLAYFESVKNHPLLDSVNYSREKWGDYLSFRTDAYAFSFDTDGQLKKNFEFSSVENHQPFEKHLNLISDFVKKSNFRNFFAEHKQFYNSIIKNYKDYYLVNETIEFLDKRIGKPKNYNGNTRYLIVLSPLVYRMNCHRDIDKQTVADFPSATEDFINVVSKQDIANRVVGNHNIFTEMDHGYINPISDKFEKQIGENFNNGIWDKESGYTGSSCFNEYMTWAVYDLFIKEYFPKVADSIAIQWQYQNASRGFFAQNLFTKKVQELYSAKQGAPFESIYDPLLKWCKKNENNISLPRLINVDKEKFVKANLAEIVLNFSEKMNQSSFCVEANEFKGNNATGNKRLIEIKDGKWSNDGKTLTFGLPNEFEKFSMVLNWWGNSKPLESLNGIHLEPQSYVLLKKMVP